MPEISGRMAGMMSGDAIVTGVVGVVGTAVGAWLTASLTGRSQREQARDADKGQVYANFLASCEKLIRPIIAYHDSPVGMRVSTNPRYLCARSCSPCTWAAWTAGSVGLAVRTTASRGADRRRIAAAPPTNAAIAW